MGAALFEASEPRHGHAGERADLFAAQACGPATIGARKPDIRRAHPTPPGAQELT